MGDGRHRHARRRGRGAGPPHPPRRRVRRRPRRARRRLRARSWPACTPSTRRSCPGCRRTTRSPSCRGMLDAGRRRSAPHVRARVPLARGQPPAGPAGRHRPRRLPARQPARRTGRPRRGARLGARPPRATRSRTSAGSARRRGASGRRRRWAASAPGRSCSRPIAAAGGADVALDELRWWEVLEHAASGGRLHGPGRRPPHGGGAVRGAGRHRPPRVRAGVGPAAAPGARTPRSATERDARPVADARRAARPARRPASCSRRSRSSCATTSCRARPGGSRSTPGWPPTSSPSCRREVAAGAGAVVGDGRSELARLGVGSEAELRLRIASGRLRRATSTRSTTSSRPASSPSSPSPTPSTSRSPDSDQVTSVPSTEVSNPAARGQCRHAYRHADVDGARLH